MKRAVLQGLQGYRDIEATGLGAPREITEGNRPRNATQPNRIEDDERLIHRLREHCPKTLGAQ